MLLFAPDSIMGINIADINRMIFVKFSLYLDREENQICVPLNACLMQCRDCRIVRRNPIGVLSWIYFTMKGGISKLLLFIKLTVT